MTFWCLSSGAQVPIPTMIQSNLRTKIIKNNADSLRIDTISIIPSTFIVKDIPASDYWLDFVKAILYWIKKPAAEDITVTYRVFPFQLNASVQRMNYDSVMNNFYVKPFEFNNGLSGEQKGIFDFGTLKAEGSF